MDRCDARGFLDRYHIHSKSQDSDETVLRDKHSGEFVLMKEVQVSSPDEFRKVIETLEAQRQLRNDHLLSLLEYQVATEYDTEEGVRQKVLTFFQYSSHNLQQQIDARFEENRLFEEGELWNILTSCALGLAYLQRECVGHGCISPLDIFIAKDGVIQVVDPSIATASPFSLQEGYYYSPEVVSSLSQRVRRQTPELEIFRSDVFSLGMCILHAAMLEAADDCYDYTSPSMNYDEIQKKLELVAEHYSEGFVEVLACMLKYEPSQRPDFLQLEQHLIELMESEQSVRSSVSSLSNSWGTGYKSTVSRLTYDQKSFAPAQPLAEDSKDSQRSEQVGLPHSETFESESFDENQGEVAKQDDFSRLLKNGLCMPRPQSSISEMDSRRSSRSSQVFAPQPQEEIVERVIKVDFFPTNENGSSNPSFSRKYFPEEMLLPTGEPIHSFGSSFGPIYFENPSNKSIFEVRQGSFQQRQNFPIDIKRSDPSRQEDRSNQPSLPMQFASFSKSSYPLFNPTQSKPSESSCYSSKDNPFTDPALLDMVREDVNKILSKVRNKENQPAN